MLIRKAFCYRLEPTPGQRQKLFQFAGCCRLVWNKGLALQKEKLDLKEKLLSYAELTKELTSWKTEDSLFFLKETPSQSLQQTLKDLHRSLWDGLKKQKGMPRFKKRGLSDSFRFPQGFKFQGNSIILPKLGSIEFRKSRELQGTPKNVTVSRQGKHWFVSIQCELEIEEPVHPSRGAVGIDLGIAKFATLSNGQVFEPLNSFKRLEEKLAKAQKSLSRKVKFSSNWKKQKSKVHSLHTSIANTRKDYLHKASTQIANENQVVILEDLKVSNMSKSAKGTVEKPGRQVAAKSGLNKSILDQGWFAFRQMLDYKLKWRGGELKIVSPHYTSQKCSSCGHTAKENRTSQSKFYCVQCGFSENADLNAALNILAVGHTVKACGDIKPVAA
jgi:putative transposase